MPIFSDAGDIVTGLEQLITTFGIPTGGPSAPGSPPTAPSAPPALPTIPGPSSTPLPGGGIALDAAGRFSSSLPVAGSELNVVQSTASFAVTATTAAGANTILTSDALTYDGYPIVVEFNTPQVVVNSNAGGNFIVFVLYEDGVQLAQLGDYGSTSNIYLEDSKYLFKRHVPAKGLHTYSLRAYRTNADCSLAGGSGAGGAKAPIFMRVLRA